ncbi:MAG TPA: hypothetical protein VJZ71_09155 [Phycisphaerae bacterium]|nr:hypothetical protein [Phycisphaerae bacterium]
MSRNRLRWYVASTLLMVVSPAWGQIKWAQPWHHPDGPVPDTRVQTCGTPDIVTVIALDDFMCTQTGPITWVTWSGDLPEGPAQRFRPFFIRIWNHINTPCTPCGNPGMPLMSWCVVPHSKKIGINCDGKTVWGFWTPLSPAFTQTAGTHYWLQISEIDLPTAAPPSAGSINPGLVDFRWSTYHPFDSAFDADPLCPAMFLVPPNPGVPVASCDLGAICAPHLNPAGFANGPDLAFKLGTTLVAGAILAPTLPLPPPTVFLAEFRATTGGEVLYTDLVEPADDGMYAIDPGLEDGSYLMTLRGMGMGAQTRPIAIGGGVAMGADFVIDRFGDLNNDELVDGTDIPIIVGGLLAP